MVATTVWKNGWVVEKDPEAKFFMAPKDGNRIFALAGVVDEDSEIAVAVRCLEDDPLAVGVTLENGMTIILPDEDDPSMPAFIPSREA